MRVVHNGCAHDDDDGVRDECVRELSAVCAVHVCECECVCVRAALGVRCSVCACRVCGFLGLLRLRLLRVDAARSLSRYTRVSVVVAAAAAAA